MAKISIWHMQLPFKTKLFGSLIKWAGNMRQATNLELVGRNKRCPRGRKHQKLGKNTEKLAMSGHVQQEKPLPQSLSASAEFNGAVKLDIFVNEAYPVYANQPWKQLKKKLREPVMVWAADIWPHCPHVQAALCGLVHYESQHVIQNNLKGKRLWRWKLSSVDTCGLMVSRVMRNPCR